MECVYVNPKLLSYPAASPFWLPHVSFLSLSLFYNKLTCVTPTLFKPLLSPGSESPQLGFRSRLPRFLSQRRAERSRNGRATPRRTRRRRDPAPRRPWPLCLLPGSFSGLTLWCVSPFRGVNMYAMLTGTLPFTVEPFSLRALYQKMVDKEMNPLPAQLSTGNAPAAPGSRVLQLWDLDDPVTAFVSS